jgi:hypothetical protein
MTIKALILSALRDAGLPVLDDDLLDRRDGAPRGRRQDLRARTPKQSHFIEERVHETAWRGYRPETPDLAAVTAMLAELISRRTGTATGPNIRISTGCCCGHQSAAKRNSSNRSRRK